MTAPAPPRLSPLQLELLRCISGGIAVAQHMVNRSSGRLSRGSVYVTLQRMQASGLVTSDVGPRPRGEGGTYVRWYRLAPAGRRALRRAACPRGRP